MSLPADLSVLDGAAVAAFVAIWFVYNVLVDGWLRRPRSINTRMIAMRRAWMTRMLARENRIMDATLIGHSIRSATFFASTTLLLLAGLVGLLGSADAIHDATANLTMLFDRVSPALFEVKLFLLVAIFVYAFFKFTWAIRQFNYFSAVMGSAPEPAATADPTAADGSSVSRRVLADRMGLMLSHAFWQFNAGVRAYYFALAALGWFIHPLLFMAATALIALILIRRQLFSATAHDIDTHVDLIAVADEEDHRPG